MIKLSNNKHEKACKIYSKYFECTSEGYDCQLCSYKCGTTNTEDIKTRAAWFRIYFHLRGKHGINMNDSNENVIKEGITETSVTVSGKMINKSLVVSACCTVTS